MLGPGTLAGAGQVHDHLGPAKPELASLLQSGARSGPGQVRGACAHTGAPSGPHQVRGQVHLRAQVRVTGAETPSSPFRRLAVFAYRSGPGQAHNTGARRSCLGVPSILQRSLQVRVQVRMKIHLRLRASHSACLVVGEGSGAIFSGTTGHAQVA